jgi:RNA polymerase sigma-70 factor (ECF subfamily)
VAAESHLDLDRRLMFKAAAGDPEAFVQLYRKFYSPIEAYLARLNGQHVSLEDLVQEVFTRVWEQRGNFRGNSSVKTYLFGIARNVMWSESKRQTLERNHLGRVEAIVRQQNADRQDQLAGPEQETHRKELREMLYRAINELSPQQRDAVQSFLIDSTSTGMAARSPHAVPATDAVRKRLAKALKTLRRQMKA